MQLPQTFLNEMKDLLQEEYDAYLKSFEQKFEQGIRVNTDKISVKDFVELAPFSLTPVPWCENGFYVSEDAQVSKHPYYFAGLYYIQEPSAMLPAAILHPAPGERVLDLCAAPGGKSTELGSCLKREGFLLANDISHSRAKGLLKNLELFGIGNVMVSSADPQTLKQEYPEFFDKILVDAPCSGEGMFRKDPDILKSYKEHGPAYYAPIQREILSDAIAMLRPGGVLVYSTCTFSRMEDEETIQWALNEYPDLELVPLSDENGMLRLFPHRIKGEGHFAAMLKKNLNISEDFSGKKIKKESERTWKSLKELPKEFLEFQKKCLKVSLGSWNYTMLENRLYAFPKGMKVAGKVRYLRTGLLLGEVKKNRFEPSQALAMFLKQEEVCGSISFSAEDPRVIRYLKGETVEVDEMQEKLPPWILVCTDGFPLGWAKPVNGSLRNKYYAGWRMNG